MIGTYFLVFAGCCSVVLNNSEKTKGVITLPGVALVWGFTVTILAYSLGHVSGAHLNPAVTLSLAIYRRFPFKMACYLSPYQFVSTREICFMHNYLLQVPLYFIAQILGSFLASGSLYFLFEIDDNSYFGTRPAGSQVQSLVFELLTTFLLMFVVCAVSTDKRAVSIFYQCTFSILQFLSFHFHIHVTLYWNQNTSYLNKNIN